MYKVTLKQLEAFSPANYQYDVRDQLRRHVYDRATALFRAGDAARDGISTMAALRARQKFIRRTFIECMGGLPEGGPLNARTVGEVAGDGFRIEKVIFESRPKHYVTANLYLPAGLERPTGAVLFVCGHHTEAKHVAEYQIVCQMLVRAGLVVLAQDPPGQGERLGYHEPGEKTARVANVAEHEYAGAQCLPLGHTIGRYFLHDAMRGVDYLLTRPEVDGRRIGVTGNSGGGLQTAKMMLADPRIAAAAPGTFIMNRETYMWTGGAQDAEQIWPGFTAAGLDHEDILLAMCPRPVRVLAVTWDFFPIEGTRRTVERCRRLWELAGKPANLDLAEDASVHQYTVPLARAAAEFFSRHLLGRELGDRELPAAPFDPKRLWCTRSGQVRGEIRGARFTHDANLQELATLKELRRDSANERRQQAVKWLRRRVFAHRTPVAPNPRLIIEAHGTTDFIIDNGWWWSQDGIVNSGAMFRARRHRGDRLPVTIALWDGGLTTLSPHLDWLRAECARGRAVFIIEPTAFGSIAARPLNANPPRGLGGVNQKLSDDLRWIDDSLPALRTWDVLRALDVAALWPNINASDLRAYGHGRPGVYLQLAAALDSRLKHLTLAEKFGSYAAFVRGRDYDNTDIKAYLLPGALQVFDLPDLKAK